MNDSKYDSTTETSYFVIPVNPVIAPTHGDTYTTAKISETIHLHGKNHRDFQLYHGGDKSLLNQLTKSTPIKLLQ